MVHEYIRTLHDDGTKVGQHIDMMRQLEDILQQTGVVQASEEMTTFDKIEVFESLLNPGSARAGSRGGCLRYQTCCGTRATFSATLHNPKNR